MRHYLHADATSGSYSGSRNNPGDDTASSSDRPAVAIGVWWGDMVAAGAGRIRTAHADGTPGAPDRCRWASHAEWRPPYRFGGRLMIHGKQTPLHPTYGLVLHPVHRSNLNNLWLRFATSDDLCILGVESGDVEHGIRYVRFPVPEFGVWHDWAIDVDAGHAVTFLWNGTVVHRWSDERLDVFNGGPVGMRLDGFDVELDGTYVDDMKGEPMPTYPYGYNAWATRLTAAQLEARTTWSRLHPEMRRRLLAMFDAAQAEGRDLGLGQGWRSSAQQEQTFRDRHFVVSSGGCCSFDGKRWQLRSGQAHAAPPFRSYHETTTSDGYALAADLIGDLVWMNANAHRFDLKHFANVNNEPWHVQPVEVPNGRSRYVEAQHRLVVPKPTTDPNKPIDQEDDDMPRELIRASDSPAVFETDGFTKAWVDSPPALDVKKMLFATRGWPTDVTVIDPKHIAGFGPVVGPIPGGHDAYGRKIA